MAFKSDEKLGSLRPPISMEVLGERIARRRAKLGDIEVPRNSGTRRTASKRALLKAIEDRRREVVIDATSM